MTSVPIGTTASVRVPATSANLGPGFDALGLALGIYDDVTATVTPVGLEIEVDGEGAGGLPTGGSHLVVRSVRAALSRLGADAPGLRLQCWNGIPQGRGLGSSAAAICAGLLLARALVGGSDDSSDRGSGGAGGSPAFDDDAVLALAAELEGHPDNVAACLRGGATIAWLDPQQTPAAPSSNPASACRLIVHPAIHPVVFIPTRRSSTRRARALLPATVPHADAAFNAARSALLVAALTADPSLLFTATADRLHQPYRAPAMRESADLVGRLRGRGFAAVISGAGPTVLALTGSTEAAEAAQTMVPPGWRSETPGIDLMGARVVGGPGAIRR